MATIFDVAQAAQVSHQTVSRVLKGDPTVSTVRRQRVEQAVQQLRYRPNAAARALASRKTRTIGLITIGQPFYGPASTAQAFNAAARASGWDVSIEALERTDGVDLAVAVEALLARDVQAVVVVAPTPQVRKAVADLPSHEVPFVMAGRGSDALESVGLDQAAGAAAAVRHLIELGHRQIAHVAGPPDWSDAQDREKSWRRVLAEADLPAGPLVHGDWTAAGGAAAARALRGSGATAVFCANDQTALGLLHALHELHVPVPERMSVVGFDDIPEAAFFTPSLTTVRHSFRALGQALLARVDQLLDINRTAPAQPPTPALIIRDSTAAN